MPSSPGVLPVIAQAQAGTVIGGVMLARPPCIPSAISWAMFGTSEARSPNRRESVAQSRPTPASLGPCCMSASSFRGPSRAGAGRAGTRGGSGVLVCYQPPRNADPNVCEEPRLDLLRRTLRVGALLLALSSALLIVVPAVIVE